jgi:sugar diacid utilization regulator
VNDLQDLVDALAAELGRPVGLDDRQFRSLAYSSHVEEVDQVRLSSILQRRAPRAVTDYLTGLRVDKIEDHLRIAAAPALGMSARVCCPVRFDETLLGYLWLFDEPVALAESEIATAEHFAVEAGAVLFRLRHLETADRSQERELLVELLGIRGGDRHRAAEALTSIGFLAATPWMYIVVLDAISAAGAAVDDALRVQLAAASDRLRRSAPPHAVLSVSVKDSIVSIVAVDSRSALQRRLDQLVVYASQALSIDTHWSPVIGVSAPLTTLAAAADAYSDARDAATAGGIQQCLRPVVRWEHLGAYRTILTLQRGSRTRAPLPPALTALLETPDADALIPTLLAYLESAGDAKATAERLFIHRSSIYNRLRRIEAVAGVDMGSGDDRLELHLGLRLWQLAGGEVEGAVPA